MLTNKGFAAITPFIVSGALILTLANGTVLRVRTQILTGIKNMAEEKALGLANACAEIAIGKLQTIFGYNGNEMVTLAGIICEILPITGSGNHNRTVITQGSVGSTIKKIRVIITQISFPTKISSWGEITD